MHAFNFKMANAEDFFSGEDLDVVFELIERDLFEENEELERDLAAVVTSIEETHDKVVFRCDFCEKICKSKQGLSRHKNSKHKHEIVSEKNSVQCENVEFTTEILKECIEHCVSKLISEDCLSKGTIETLTSYNVTLDEASYCYEHLKDVVQNYKGDKENFLPAFYKLVMHQKIFRSLSDKKSLTALGFELGNVVLSHITAGGSVKKKTVELERKEFTSKERNIAKYLSGYVFGTLYRRIRYSKHKHFCTETSSSFQSILLAGKLENEESIDQDDKLIEAKNRGGLWLVKGDILELFLIVERYFRKETMLAKSARKIDSHAMISNLISNSNILTFYNNIVDETMEKINKEIALNLLEHILMLYIRARTFSFVKDKKEIFHLEGKKKKLKSLRKSIKEASSSLEHGH